MPTPRLPRPSNVAIPSAEVKLPSDQPPTTAAPKSSPSLL